MIRTVKATHIWGEIEATTRTRPLRVECLDVAGERFDVYVKLLARSDMGTNLFVSETLCGSFAQLLNLKVPEPLAVEFPHEMLPALTNRQIADDIMNSGNLQFGSKSLSPGWHTAGGVPQRMRRKEDLADALVILLMDLIAENGDRSENNPNLMISAKGLAPIDHELAFSNFPFTEGDLAPFRPWEPAFLAQAKTRIERHLLFKTLSGRQLDFAAAGDRFKKITPSVLRALVRKIPEPWVNLNSPPDRITRYLVEARKNMPTLLQILEHTLRRP